MWGSGTLTLHRPTLERPWTSTSHPTTTPAARARLTPDEARIYDLVCRRLLAAWHEDHLYSTTTVITAVASEQAAKRREAEEAEIGANQQVDLARTHADREVEEQKIEMERIVRELASLSESEAALAVEIAKTQARLLGGTARTGARI